MTELLVDTSVAVPLLLTSHEAHGYVVERVGDRSVALAGHALYETYAVLTRLPGDARLSPGDAARLLAERFDPAVVLDTRSARGAPGTLAGHEVAGGATYDALIALAAKPVGAPLASRDRRAEGTYRRLGVPVEMLI
ncbi:MAG: type II toxin-antitoxin system VapC family toxin [Actinomycetota bacterium]|nr:type II toxin-antitoxin system VapC family toxin [Actinomycetota bacterium]